MKLLLFVFRVVKTHEADRKINTAVCYVPYITHRSVLMHVFLLLKGTRATKMRKNIPFLCDRSVYQCCASFCASVVIHLHHLKQFYTLETVFVEVLIARV